MIVYCIAIPNLECVCATQLFPRDDSRKQKNSADTDWSGHTPRSGPEVKDKEGKVKKQFTVEVKKQDTLRRDE